MANCFRNIGIGAIVLYTTVALLLFSTLFVSHGLFVEARILPKWYGFIIGTVLLSGITVLFGQKISLSIDHIFLTIILFLGYLQAFEVARIIVNKEIKVPSRTVQDIIRKAEILIEGAKTKE